VVYLMHGLGIATGIDLARVVEAGRFISNHLGRKPVSRAGNALLARKAAA
jgi:hydroxymethylglutaryl-CoA lyase